MLQKEKKNHYSCKCSKSILLFGFSDYLHIFEYQESDNGRRRYNGAGQPLEVGVGWTSLQTLKRAPWTQHEALERSKSQSPSSFNESLIQPQHSMRLKMLNNCWKDAHDYLA